MTTFQNKYPLPQRTPKQSPVGPAAFTPTAGSYLSRTTPPQQAVAPVQVANEPPPWQGAPERRTPDPAPPAAVSAEVASAFDAMDAEALAGSRMASVDPMVKAAFAEMDDRPLRRETDPLKMTPEEAAADRERGMNAPPLVRPAPDGESFDAAVERMYGMTRVQRYALTLPRLLLDPATGTEVATRNQQMSAVYGTPERGLAARKFMSPVDVNAMSVQDSMKPLEAPAAFGDRTWASLRNGMVSLQSDLNGLAAFGWRVGQTGWLAPSVADGIVKRSTDYAEFVAREMQQTQPKSQSVAENLYYSTMSALPNLALQVAAGVAAAPARAAQAAFVAVGGGTSAGGQFNQSMTEYRQVLADANPSMPKDEIDRQASGHAAAEAAIAGTITVVTNKVPAEAFFGRFARKGLRTLTGYALAKAVSRKVVYGALAEGGQDFMEQMGTDVAVHSYRTMRPEWDKALAENPHWLEFSLLDAWNAAMTGAVLGGAVGGTNAAAETTRPRLTDAEREIRGSVKADGKYSRDKAVQVVERMAKHEDAVVEAVAVDQRHQRRIAEALDLSGYTDERLGQLALKSEDGATARLAGGVLPDMEFIVTPTVAATEIVRRARGETPRVVGGPLDVGQDGTVSDDAVADWKARNPDKAASLASAPALTRAVVERMVGRAFEGNSKEFRAALHQKIKSVQAAKGARELTAEEVASEITGLPSDQAVLVMSGMSPQTAAKVAEIRAEEAERGPVGSRASGIDRIAEINGMPAQSVVEITELNDGEKAVKAFAGANGAEVRFFSTKDPVWTRGVVVDGTVWLNADMDTDAMRHAVAVHELAHVIAASDPDAFRSMADALEKAAPEAVKSLRAKYAGMLEKAGQAVSADMQEEGVTNLLEGLFDAYALHLAVTPDGKFDVAKARAMVGADPGLFARIADMIHRMLVRLGVAKEDARIRRLREYAGGTAAELESPNVRAFIAQQFGSALSQYRKSASPTTAAQSIGKPARSADQQRRIDMAFQMGRRSGLVAGEVEGQKTGRSDERKVQEALRRQAVREERAKAARRIADVRTRLAERVRSLRERLAAAPNEAAVRRQVRKEIAGLLKESSDIVAQLPKAERGRYTRRLAKATTMRRKLRLVDDVSKALALVPVQTLKGEVVRQSKRLAKWGMQPDTAEVVKQIHADALSLLSEPGGGRLRYTSDADLASRVATVKTMLESALETASADRAVYKTAKTARAARNAALTKQAASDLEEMKPLGAEADTTAPKSSVAQALLMRGSFDMHTAVHWIEGSGQGGAFSSAHAALVAGEDAQSRELGEIRRMVDGLLKDRYGDRHGYDRVAAGSYGDAAARVVKATLGGKEVEAKEGFLLSLAAQDEHAVTHLVKDGFVWRSNKDMPRIVPTREEIAALKSEYGSVVDAIKKAFGDRLADRYFQKFFELNGRNAPMVPGYYRTERIGDPTGEVDPQGPQDMAGAMFRDASDQHSRTGSSKPFVVGDFMETMDRHAEGALRVIHLAEPARTWMTLISDEKVRNGMDRVFGPKMREKFRLWLLNGLGFGREKGTPVDKAISAATGGVLLLNLRTYLRQPGGVFKAMSEMQPGSLAKGISGLGTLLADSKERKQALADMMDHGYFLHRWESSQVGRMAGLEGGKGADVARMKAALRGFGAALKASGKDAASANVAGAAKKLGQAVSQLTRASRAVEFPLRTVDQIIALAVMLGHESTGIGRKAAVEMAARTFRRTQNASSPFDDSFLQATAKVQGGGWASAKLLFPFSSDTIKSYNQMARAWRSGTASDRARTAAGLAANSLWAASVNPVVLAFGYATAVALGDDRDEKELDGAIRASIAESERVSMAGRLANDAVSQTTGYLGILAGNIIEASIQGRNPDLSSQILPLRMANELGGSIQRMDAAGTTSAALVLAGVPQVQPALMASSVKSKVSPDDEKVMDILRRRRSAGTATRAQLATLARMEAMDRASYAANKESGDLTKRQKARLDAEKRRLDARTRQMEALRDEPSS